MLPRPRVAKVLAWAALAATLAQSGSAPGPPPRDLVLLIVDTLRADHVGVYGYSRRPTTPSLDAFARRGVWLTEAWATAPWTPPSILSILTSLEPRVHGLELDAEQYAARIPALPAAARTLAEVLRERGYRTLAVTGGGGIGSRYGFARGFERFHEPPRPLPEDVAAGVDLALDWLREESSRPTFLLFHTYEVHQPSTHGVPVPGDDAAAAAARAYDADLAFADRELGRLLRFLEPRLDRTVVVLVADHGENLADRALQGPAVEHGHHLHQELLRVPFLVVAPGLVPARGAVSGPVQLTDVMPTALGLLGIESRGLVLQGRDLGGLLHGQQAPDLERALFATAPLQGPTWGSVRTRTAAAIVAPPVPGTNWWARVGMPALSLHDRSSDPGETVNLAGQRPAQVRALALRLSQRQQENARLRRRLGAGPDAPAPEDTVENLRSLGYLGGER